MALGCAVYPPGPVSIFFQSSLVVVAVVHLAIIIRTTRASPASTVALDGEMPVGTHHK